jgi:hypothetical protein
MRMNGPIIKSGGGLYSIKRDPDHQTSSLASGTISADACLIFYCAEFCDRTQILGGINHAQAHRGDIYLVVVYSLDLPKWRLANPSLKCTRPFNSLPPAFFLLSDQSHKRVITTTIAYPWFLTLTKAVAKALQNFGLPSFSSEILVLHYNRWGSTLECDFRSGDELHSPMFSCHQSSGAPDHDRIQKWPRCYNQVVGLWWNQHDIQVFLQWIFRETMLDKIQTINPDSRGERTKPRTWPKQVAHKFQVITVVCKHFY